MIMNVSLEPLTPHLTKDSNRGPFGTNDKCQTSIANCSSESEARHKIGRFTIVVAAVSSMPISIISMKKICLRSEYFGKLVSTAALISEAC